jgi:type III pantothenate kinase
MVIIMKKNAETATLVVDIGNTNITCGIYEQEKLVRFARFCSSIHRTADEYFSLLIPLLNSKSLNKINNIIIGSVVPELMRIWMHLFQKYLTAEIWEINALSHLGIKYKVDDPSFIGADLIANAFGALKKYHSDCIIIDLGTATTIQFISKEGSFEGTAIAPGLKVSSDTLFEKAALLSQIEIVSPSVLLGTNTRDALLSGIVNGHAYMLESYIQNIKMQYPNCLNIITILTGGIADLIYPLVPSIDIVDKTLTLDGFYLAYKTINH